MHRAVFGVKDNITGFIFIHTHKKVAKIWQFLHVSSFQLNLCSIFLDESFHKCCHFKVLDFCNLHFSQFHRVRPLCIKLLSLDDVPKVTSSHVPWGKR